MLSVPALNDAAPDFALQGILFDKVRLYRLSDYRRRWVTLFFYPADFTFVCPTEVLGFQRRLGEFRDSGADVLGVSVDDIESHRKWTKELGGLAYPLLSDPDRAVCRSYGVLNPAENRAWRATFLIGPEGRIAWATLSPMNVGRSVAETLRVLRALQTGRLCPADWRPGDPTIESDAPY